MVLADRYIKDFSYIIAPVLLSIYFERSQRPKEGIEYAGRAVLIGNGGSREYDNRYKGVNKFAICILKFDLCIALLVACCLCGKRGKKTSVLMRFEYFFELLMGVLEYFQYPGVEVRRHGPVVSFGNDLECLFVVKRRFIWPSAAEGVILVRKVHDPPLNGYFITLQPPGIPAAVPPLVVGQGYPLRQIEHDGAGAMKDPGADGRVGFYQGELLGIQPRGLQDDVRGYAHFADVVHRTRVEDHLRVLFGHPELFCHQRAIIRYPLDMRARVLVLEFRHDGEPLDGVDIAFFDIVS